MEMRILAATGLVALLTFTIWAQRGQTPAGAAPMISASDVAAMIAKSPSDKNALGQRMLQLGSYNVNMEHRVMGQAAAVHGIVLLQESHGGIDIVDDVSIAQASSPGDDIVRALGTVAVIEIRRRCHITRLRQPTGDILNEFVHTALMLGDHDCWERT